MIFKDNEQALFHSIISNESSINKTQISRDQIFI